MARRNVSFAISPDLYERFQQFANENGISMAEAYRDALSLYAEINIPTPEQQAEGEALLAQVRAERARQEVLVALPTLVLAPVGLPN